MDSLFERLDRMEAKLDSLVKPPPPTIIGVRDVMELTGCKSKTAQRVWFHKYGVKPYAHGKYIRLDVTNKVAALALGL